MSPAAIFLHLALTLTPPAKNQMVIGFVLLDQARPVPFAQIAADHQRRWHKPLKIKTDAAGTSFELESGFAAIQVVPAPIPKTDHESMIRRSFEWDGAEQAVRTHRAHLIVVHMFPDHDTKTGAIRLTRLLASISATMHPLGIEWGAAGHVVDPGVWMDRSRDIDPSNPPLSLWIAVDAETSDAKKWVSRTFGLVVFGLPEVRVVGRANDGERIMQMGNAVVSYLMENGMILKTGHTIGRSPTEKYPVTVLPDPEKPERKLVEIDLTGQK